MKRMNKNDIIALPHESLRQRSSRITDFGHELHELLHDMVAAGLDWENSREHEICVGLAAVQVNIMKRAVIIRANQEDRNNKEFINLVNPKIIRHSGKPEMDFEGCLSVRDIYGKVPRYPKVTVEAQDENGETFRLKAEGFLARLLQHEVDHTNGIVFIDHIKDKDLFHTINDEGKIVPMELNKVQAMQELWDE